MGGYVVNQPYTLRAGEKISVRVDHANFGVRTPAGSTARVYLDESRPETLVNISANQNVILTSPPPYPRWASVEALTGFVIINDPAGTGVPDFGVRYW